MLHEYDSKNFYHHDIENNRIEPMKVNRTAKYDNIDYQDFFSASDLLSEDENTLAMRTNKELEKLCVEFGCKKSGKKSEKVHSLMGAFSDILEKLSYIDSEYSTNCGKIALDYTLNTGLYKVIAFTQVKAMAGRGYPIYDKNEKSQTYDKIIGFRPHECCESCRILLERGDKDITWDDVYQETALALYECGLSGDYPTIENGYPRLTGSIYRAVRRNIGKMFRTMRMSQKQAEESSLEVLICDRSGEEEKVISLTNKSKSDSEYIQALAINVPEFDDILTDSWVQGYFKWLGKQKEYIKYYTSMVSVFLGRKDALNNQEIMSKYSISRRIFDKAVKLLHESYIEYGTKCYKTRLFDSFDIRQGCTYRKSESGISGSYEFSYGILSNSEPVQKWQGAPVAPEYSKVKNLLTGKECMREYSDKKTVYSNNMIPEEKRVYKPSSSTGLKMDDEFIRKLRKSTMNRYATQEYIKKHMA